MRYLFLLLLLPAFFSCEEEEITLSGDVPQGTLSVTPRADNGNYIITEVDSDASIFLVDFGNGQTSTQRVDTAYFPVGGTYTIKLMLSGAGGQTTVTETITITTDDLAICNNESLIRLTGGCLNDAGKTWAWSDVSGAITVGPNQGSGEWYTSPAAGLAPEQDDDVYTFKFEDNAFIYQNQGLTVDPNQGFQAVPYDAPSDATWQLSFGTGPNGEDQIILSPGSFMGTLDSGTELNIVTLTETELVVQTQFVNGGGWFEFYFVAQ